MQDNRISTKNKRPNLTANSIRTYMDNVSTMSASTAYEYLARLNDFKNFIANKYNNQLTLEDLLSKIKKGKEDPYLVLKWLRCIS
jgi:hypothetical protein